MIRQQKREGPNKATFSLAPCVETDLGAEDGVVGACRVGADTPFFSS